jgi:hypothetical protein
MLEQGTRFKFELNCNSIALIDAAQQNQSDLKTKVFLYENVHIVVFAFQVKVAHSHLKLVKCMKVRLQFACVGAWYL